MLSWLWAFALTQLIEVPIYVLAMRKHLPLARCLAVAFGASALPHPIVWFVIPRIWSLPTYWGMVVFAEVFAVVAEALYLRWCRIPRPWLWARVANVTSAGSVLLWKALV